jgi:hypothetical protein
MTHTYNPSTQKLRQEDKEFQATLGYIAKPCRKERKKERDGGKEGRKEGRNTLSTLAKKKMHV